eukprot:CAMPEP_0176052204 /NCGR_PEP_ID=MMETSP0120_2-20121206/25956_1 /TAXON_ID=160619 /ORGANISM="Kryptoperidinium foliaceum, Strain CCMP 1326" /LENGTH=161 /DNA_ID=CAMNT_0017385645 /DNA_START=20 /DNA_END=504 /DNA_ORIENTATION=-
MARAKPKRTRNASTHCKAALIFGSALCSGQLRASDMIPCCTWHRQPDPVASAPKASARSCFSVGPAQPQTGPGRIDEIPGGTSNASALMLSRWRGLRGWLLNVLDHLRNAAISAASPNVAATAGPIGRRSEAMAAAWRPDVLRLTGMGIGEQCGAIRLICE